MNLIKKLSKHNLLSKLLTYVLILLGSTFLMLFSFNIDAFYKNFSSYFWFIRSSQLFNLILIVYSLTNIIKIYYCYKNFVNDSRLNNSNKFQSTVPNLNLYSKMIKSTLFNEENFLNDELKNVSLNETKKVNNINTNNEDKNNDHIVLHKDFYDYLPLPIVITNEDGKIIQCNNLAKDFFKSTLIDKNISNFIKPLNNTVINDYLIVNAIINKEKNFVSSIFQTSVFKQSKVLSYVVLLFLPCSLNTQETNTKNTELINTSKDNLLGITNLTTIILENFGNYLNFGILILNKNKDIICINNKAMELLSNEFFSTNNKSINKTTLINKNFIELFNKTLKEDQLCSLLKDTSGQIQLNIKNSFFLEIHSQKVHDNIIITLFDISEKRKLELQNNFSQRLQTIGQIASAVAHDFNNLLTAIMSFTYFLKERYTSEDPSTLELEQIEQNANRAKVMIRQLLTFSRSKDLNPITFAVNSEISNLMSTILRLMGERIKTEFIRGKNIGEITMDPVQFQQVIINLVVNARDAMKNGGNLTISTERITLKQAKEAVIVTIPAGEYVVINIKDEGEGIEKANFKKIFQTHFSTKGDKGNGLGLATVAKIMQENSGYIALESVLSKGSIFSLYFTTEHKGDSKAVDEQVNEHENFSIVKVNTLSENVAVDLTGDGTILLVEDEIPVRTVCKRALVSKGYTVIEAEDAESALSILQNSVNKVDLIISDVMMPGLSGLEFISEARKLNPNIKAILMSGYAEDTLEDNHYTLDSIEFLAKPFNPDVLTTKVKKVINNLGD